MGECLTDYLSTLILVILDTPVAIVLLVDIHLTAAVFYYEWPALIAMNGRHVGVGVA